MMLSSSDRKPATYLVCQTLCSNCTGKERTAQYARRSSSLHRGLLSHLAAELSHTCTQCTAVTYHTQTRRGLGYKTHIQAHLGVVAS